MSWIPQETLDRLKNVDFKDMENVKITLPILRKVFPKLMAKELVSVQPMTNDIDFKKLDAVLARLKTFEEFFTEEEFNIK